MHTITTEFTTTTSEAYIYIYNIAWTSLPDHDKVRLHLLESGSFSTPARPHCGTECRIGRSTQSE